MWVAFLLLLLSPEASAQFGALAKAALGGNANANLNVNIGGVGKLGLNANIAANLAVGTKTPSKTPTTTTPTAPAPPPVLFNPWQLENERPYEDEKGLADNDAEIKALLAPEPIAGAGDLSSTTTTTESASTTGDESSSSTGGDTAGGHGTSSAMNPNDQSRWSCCRICDDTNRDPKKALQNLFAPKINGKIITDANGQDVELESIKDIEDDDSVYDSDGNYIRPSERLRAKRERIRQRKGYDPLPSQETRNRPRQRFGSKLSPREREATVTPFQLSLAARYLPNKKLCCPVCDWPEPPQLSSTGPESEALPTLSESNQEAMKYYVQRAIDGPVGPSISSKYSQDMAQFPPYHFSDVQGSLDFENSAHSEPQVQSEPQSGVTSRRLLESNRGLPLDGEQQEPSLLLQLKQQQLHKQLSKQRLRTYLQRQQQQSKSAASASGSVAVNPFTVLQANLDPNHVEAAPGTSGQSSNEGTGPGPFWRIDPFVTNKNQWNGVTMILEDHRLSSSSGVPSSSAPPGPASSSAGLFDFLLGFRIGANLNINAGINANLQIGIGGSTEPASTAAAAPTVDNVIPPLPEEEPNLPPCCDVCGVDEPKSGEPTSDAFEIDRTASSFTYQRPLGDSNANNCCTMCSDG